MGKLWENPDEPGSSPTIAINAIVSHNQQDNKTYGEARQIFETTAAMDKSLKHQIIESIEDTYIIEFCKK